MKAGVFKEGEKVICKNTINYSLTEGKEYTVIAYDPPTVIAYDPPTGTPHFTFPAYVTVEDDEGKKTTAHAHRFYSRKTLDK